jgi:hypothetical protein
MKIPWNKNLTKETDGRVAKIANSLIGHKAWNKGLTKETDERIRKYSENSIRNEKIKISRTGLKHSIKTRIMMSKQNSGENNPNYGKKHPGINKGKKNYMYKRFGKLNPFYGKKHTKETRLIISKTNKGIKRTPEQIKQVRINSIGKNNGMYGIHRYGKENPRYIDGRSFIPYPAEFKYIKSKILERDNYTCKKCITKPKIPNLLGNRISVHHIDYNKKNNSKDNLIALCTACNSKVNTNREYWTQYFQGVLNAR